MSDDYIYGICPDCGYAYTEPIDNFVNWLPPGCPRCKSQTTPYPVTEEKLPAPPPLLPLTVEQAFCAPKQWLMLLLCKDIGYRLGMWVGSDPPAFGPTSQSIRYLGMGGDRGSVAIHAASIVAAWRIGDRPDR